MNLDFVIPSEVMQAEKDKYTANMRNLKKKNSTNEVIYKTE